MKHKQIEVQYGQIKTEVDVRMAPMLQKLWAKGILTAHSCQGGNTSNNRAYIHFTDYRSAVEFHCHLSHELFDYLSFVVGQWYITPPLEEEFNICFRFESGYIDRLTALIEEKM